MINVSNSQLQTKGQGYNLPFKTAFNCLNHWPVLFSLEAFAALTTHFLTSVTDMEEVLLNALYNLFNLTSSVHIHASCQEAEPYEINST